MTAKEKVNILMVDDQPSKLLSYEVILGELGENLVKATSGKEALELLLKNDFAVVLMDVSMPEIDGFEMVDIIRQHPRFQKTAIIFISAVHMTDLDRLKGYQRGAVDYISVPVVPELLRAKVSVFAELHRKTHQLELLNKELRRLSGSLISSQDEERRRIARELHDGLGQDLTVVKIMLQGVFRDDPLAKSKQPAVADIYKLIDGALQQVRSVSYLLHPPLLDEVGLRSALGWYLDGLSKRGGIDITMETQPQEFPRLAPELETTLFRVIQEALTNVFRHSRASKACVTLERKEAEILATVRDNGVGIHDEISEFRPESIGVGIGGMRQRVKELGGQLALRNAGPGTIVDVMIPITSIPSADRAVPVTVT
ncbi:MAG: response regulator [Acidobacteriia bacterium]|nr:response regulator [Terriglobia bacterium]